MWQSQQTLLTVRRDGHHAAAGAAFDPDVGQFGLHLSHAAMNGLRLLHGLH
jgi:hypothetical protein